MPTTVDTSAARPALQRTSPTTMPWPLPTVRGTQRRPARGWAALTTMAVGALLVLGAPPASASSYSWTDTLEGPTTLISWQGESSTGGFESWGRIQSDPVDDTGACRRSDSYSPCHFGEILQDRAGYAALGRDWHVSATTGSACKFTVQLARGLAGPQFSVNVEVIDPASRNYLALQTTTFVKDDIPRSPVYRGVSASWRLTAVHSVYVRVSVIGGVADSSGHFYDALMDDARVSCA
jgi:hypothetical protein